MSNFLLGSYGLRAVDNNGAPIAGAKLNTYEVGTTTPKTTYSDRALTSANANPVVADANGWFDFIYGADNEGYKFVLTDASDVTIKTWDDVFTVDQSSSGANARLKKIASTPLEFGAIGDGAADESTQVQAAIDAANTSGGVVDLAGLVYRCDTGLTLYAGITLKNGTLNFESSASSVYINIAGSKDAATALTSDVTYEDSVIDVTAIGNIAAGELVAISSDENWAGNVANQTRGEIQEVRSFAGTAVTLNRPTEDEYTVAQNAQAERIATIDDVTLDGVSLICSLSAAGSPVAIGADFARRLQVTNCVVTGAKTTAVQLRSCWDTLVDNCDIGESAAGATGILVSRSVHTTIRNTHLRGLIVGTTLEGGNNIVYTAGPSRHTTIDNCTYDYCINGLSVTSNFSQGLRVSRCNFYGILDVALVPNGVDVSVENCDVKSAGKCIDASPAAPNRTRDFTWRCTGNRLVSSGEVANVEYDVGSVVGGGGDWKLIEIARNDMHGTGVDYINNGTSSNSTVKAVRIRGNTVTRAAGGAAIIDVVHTNDDVRTEIVSVTENIGNGGIDVDGNEAVDFLEVSRNTLDEPNLGSLRGVWLKACLEIVCRDNTAYYASTEQDLVVGSEAVGSNLTPERVLVTGNYGFNDIQLQPAFTAGDYVVSGNHVTGTIQFDGDSLNGGAVSLLITGNHCQRIDIDGDNAQDVEYAVVTGNVVQGVTGGAGITVDSLVDYVMISGNIVARADDLAPGIDANAGDVIVVGNILINGTYGVDATGSSAHFVSQNSIQDMATGALNGVTNTGTTTTGGGVNHT